MISTTKKKKRTIFLWAFLLWTLWVIFYAVVMYLQIPQIPFYVAVISSANYNYIYALLSILIWKICQKLSFDKVPKFLFVSVHFLLANLFSGLWLFLFYGLWYLAQGKIIFEIVNFREIVGWQFLFGISVYCLITGIFYSIIYYRNYKQKELAEAELKILTRDAELKALKLQMNPHFLFNSLNSINALVTKDAKLARRMISQLSELLRMSLESHEKLMIPLQQELDLVHTYLSIEQIRFENKMKFKEEIDPSLLSKSFPAMLLQPLIENAVKHGIANSRKGGSITLDISKADDQLVGTITNTKSENISLTNTQNGLSFNNIHQRLDRMYGEKYQWEIDDSLADIFKVTFKIPILKG
ncbi:histidine kinase [candidate division KSB1 bacterium]|nr:histidine kinase [candidate division KSB1 bacterium]